ncbi:MAG: hypothetical protein WAU91_16685 [Desulfatitalea sp.]
MRAPCTRVCVGDRKLSKNDAYHTDTRDFAQAENGLDHRSGQARAFFSARQELAVAQTACRSYKNALAWPALHMALAETMIKAKSSHLWMAAI